MLIRSNQSFSNCIPPIAMSAPKSANNSKSSATLAFSNSSAPDATACVEVLCFVSNQMLANQRSFSLNGFFAFRFVFFDAPFRWTEPNTWPWFLYIWLAFVLGGWLLPLWRWLQREQAKSWPTTTGRIDSAYVAEPKRFLGLTLQPNRSRTYDAVLEYSYTLSGDAFRAKYKRSFGSEGEALEFLRDLEGQTVPVQYHSSKPARSVLLEATVETLLRNRPALPDSGLAGSWMEPLPNWLKPLVGFFAFLALIGLLLSIWVHVGALFGRRVAPDYFFALLHVGIFVVFFPAIFVAQKRVGSANRKDFWKVVTKGSPDGLRYLLYFFFAYAFVNFAIFMAQAPTGKQTGETPAVVWRGFSGHWMVFYCASFVILSSTLHSSRRRS